MSSRDIDQTSEKMYFITGSLSTSAAALGSPTQNLTELVIQADPDNTANLVIGDASTQGWKILPGGEFNCPIKNPGLIFGKAASGTVNYSMFGRAGT